MPVPQADSTDRGFTTRLQLPREQDFPGLWCCQQISNIPIPDGHARALQTPF